MIYLLIMDAQTVRGGGCQICQVTDDVIICSLEKEVVKFQICTNRKKIVYWAASNKIVDLKIIDCENNYDVTKKICIIVR